MRLLLAVLVSLCVLEVVFAQNNRKKFGAAKSNPDYDPPAEDYEGDALYYEDYDEQGTKKDKDAPKEAGKDDKSAAANKEKTDKPSLPRTSVTKADDNKDHKDGHASLFAPRRNRTPFSPRPVNKPKPTLPSFIKKPVDPGSITTPKTPPSRSATFSATTAKTASVIRATTARPSRSTTAKPSPPKASSPKHPAPKQPRLRKFHTESAGTEKSGTETFKNGAGTEARRDRTTSSPSTADDRNRRFGASATSRNVNKPPRGNFRAGAN